MTTYLGPFPTEDCLLDHDAAKPAREDARWRRRSTWSVTSSVPGAAAMSPVPGFITVDPRTVGMLSRARHYAGSDLPILLEGDSGTGKELLAEAMHRLSRRASRPWIPVNCGALPHGLQEAELFGAVRGAYTGASHDRVGLIEAADTGTLFLDEVGEMDPPTQAKLLRFLEQGEIRRLGETRIRNVDVRVVAATNRNLLHRVEARKFRGDLFYRLCGAPVRVPGLDERPCDIPVLFRYFLGRVERRYAFSAVVDPGVADHLATMRWPGNVRQLRNEVERAAVLAEGEGRTIGPGDFHRDDVTSARSSFAARVAEFERRLIHEALDRTGWNRTRAATYLGGMKRTTLIGKMQRLGIVDPGGGA